MDYNEEIYKKLLENFNLLQNIICQPASDTQSRVDLSKIEEIINKKIPDT